MLSRFHLGLIGLPERDGQTDGQNCYINIARQCAIKTGIHFAIHNITQSEKTDSGARPMMQKLIKI